MPASTTKEGAITVTRGHVQSVEGDRVHVAVGPDLVVLPSALLPDGIAAGHWIELRIKGLPPPPPETR